MSVTPRRDIYRILVNATATRSALEVDVGATVHSVIVTTPATMENVAIPGRVVEMRTRGCIVELGGDCPGLSGERFVPWCKVVPVAPAAEPAVAAAA